LRNDDNPLDLATSWVVESKLSREEFKDYNNALSMFDKISKDGTQIILYEIRRKRSDGSTVKKTPLLNSKKFNTKPTSFRKFVQNKSRDKPDYHPKSKNIFKGYRARIFFLIIVLFAFVSIIFIMNSIAGR
jgi:hypothetical protein